MGKIPRFRKRSRWTRTRGYGPFEPSVTATAVARDTLGWLRTLRPFILAAILVAAWPTLDPALVEPPAFLSTEPERVSAQFTRCGIGRGYACVIDGDTFKLGERKVRIIGIDAPETHPARCTREADLGEAATARLQRLLNEGPFEMVGRIVGSTDRYGRDLRIVRRKRRDGSVQSIAAEMRSSGLAKRYVGGFKSGWC